MADKFIEIEIEDEHTALYGLERVQIRTEKLLRDLIDDIGQAAAFTLIAGVPQHSQYTLRHIQREGPRWYPGGAGGGGEWKSIVGIREGESRHPIYAEFGTGIYAGRGLIWASGVRGLTGRYQKVMVFEKRGERPKFRYWVRGQMGQHYFHTTWLITEEFARARILSRAII